MRYSSAWFHLSVSLLCLAGLLASTAPCQDIHDARRAFKAAIRNADLDQRKTGVDALVASKDARGLEDLLSATLRTTRSLEKVEKQLDLLKKPEDIKRPVGKKKTSRLREMKGRSVGSQKAR